jgi:hypothetical protein
VASLRVAGSYRYRQALLRERVQRAARASWERRLFASPKVQAVATIFVRLTPPAPEPDGLRADRVEDRLCQVEGVGRVPKAAVLLHGKQRLRPWREE